MGVKFSLQDLYDKGFDVNLKGGKAEKRSKLGNKKVENAGHKFDSRLESNFFNLLTLHKVRFRMKDTIVLQHKFQYLGESIREVKIIPDFSILDTENNVIAIVDTKGFQTEKNKLQIKLLKHYLDPQIPIYLPKNKAESGSVLNKILML